MEKKTSRKKALTTTVIIVLLALIGGTIGGAIAYFSGTAETKAFKFIAGAGEQDEDGSIEIEALRWEEPDDPLAPGQVLAMDPSVTSHVGYDGWVIMKVTSPKISASMYEDGECSNIEAFNFYLNSTDFTLLKTEDEADAVVRYYGYNQILSAGSNTPALFREVTYRDFTKVESDTSGQVDVDAAIVQNVDPSTGAYFASVEEAFQALGESFEAGNANFS